MTIHNNTVRFACARKGFTLIEIMISVGIILMLTIGAATTINYYQGKIKRSTARTTMQTIKTAIMQFHNDTGKYPDPSAGGLTQLVKKPEGMNKWDSAYLPKKEVPLDPWGNKYQYRLTPDKKEPYELYSFGSSSGKSTPKDQWLYAE